MTTIQFVMFGVMLYLMPSVLLLALLVCREEFDRDADGLKSDHAEVGGGA
jgi:hypothetical protein